ncbi:hypothetical protein D3C87_1788520 [compost metagenome]
MLGRGQIHRVLGLQHSPGGMPHQGDRVAQTRGEDRALFGPAAIPQIGVAPHLGRRGLLDAGSARIRSWFARRIETAVAGRPDINQQVVVPVEDKTRQRVAVIVQAVVRQVADHGPHA